MKKINIVILSMLTVLLSGVLMACTFKKPEAKFSQEEIVVSVGKEVDLDQYLSVKEIEKSQVEIVVAKTDLFDVDGHKLTATKSGKTDVYAFYQKNILSSVSVVVRKAFDAPTQFEFSENGVISWNVPVSYFENESEPTSAREYLVEGTRTIYSAENPEIVESVTNISQVVNTNSFVLQDAGVYKLTVSAKEYGYFAQSVKSAIQTFNFGYMDDVELSWDSETGILSWSMATEDSLYRVKLDGVLLDDKQTQNFKDLSSFLANKEAGQHSVSVFVYDANGNKLAKESEALIIEKLGAPVASYDYSSEKGGILEFKSSIKVGSYRVLATNLHTEEMVSLDFENKGQNIETSLTGLDCGLYDIQVVALAKGENLYQSNPLHLGKVYKLDKLGVQGLGSDEENNFKVHISGQESAFDTLVRADVIDCVVTGLQIGESEKNIALSIASSGKFAISLVQTPTTSVNTYDGQQVFVLNSDESNILSVTKVGNFEDGVTHSYIEEKSIFSFNEVQYADSYQLLRYDGTDYVAIDVEPNINDGVKFVLSGKIEDIFDPAKVNDQLIYRFKMVAKTADDTLAINSYYEKDIVLLSAPTSANSGNSTDKTYIWNASSNADSYALEIYTLDAATFNTHNDDENFQPSSEPLKVSTENTFYTFENVGYYFVKVYAVSADENEFISSKDFMSEMFYIAEQVQIGEVAFGYDEQYKNYSGFTQSSGYFVKIEHTDNINKYKISVDDTSNSFEIAGEGCSIYLFTETFAQGGTDYEVSVVAHAEDETLYQKSEPSVITVSRLNAVTYEDMIIDDLTKTLTVRGRDGVSSILIWESDNNTASTTNEGQDAVFDISKLSNFDLEFSLYGSETQDGLYSGNHVYLDSETSTFAFKRLASPTNLKYYDGNLTMEHSAISSTAYYVLDIICTSANDTTYNLSVMLKKNNFVVNYNGVAYTLQGKNDDFILYSGTTVTLKLSNILQSICEEETLGDIYNQATTVNFAVYAYQKSELNGDVVLSSFCATTYKDTTKRVLSVEKMPAPELEFSNYKTASSGTDYEFSWKKLSSSLGAVDVSSDTTYSIKCNQISEDDSEVSYNEITGSYTATFSASLFSTATYYDVCITASNPYFLGEGVSNIVRIYKLRPVQRLNVLSDGLGYTLQDSDFASGVQVVTKTGSVVNTSGKIEITESGTYALTVLGKIVENADVKIYYIDSAPATWTLQEMKTIKPDDETLTLSNNLLSWNAFAKEKGLNSLSYLVIFKDAEGNFVTHSTISTSVNLQNDPALFNSISTSLLAGDITISVSAYLAPYEVAAGGDIYYSKDVTLLNGTKVNNHYLYDDQSSIKKLSTPEITNVEFVCDDLESAQFPDIKVSFVGNYGVSGQFTIFINGEVLKTLDISQEDDSYSFTLKKADYNNAISIGGIMAISISAISSTDIPSSIGSVEIERAYTLQSVALSEVNDSYTHVLKVEFEPDYLDSTVGGVVLEIVYNNGTGETTEYKLLSVDSLSESLTYDLTDFFDTNLANGGTIKFSAFINNFSNGGKYYLACPTTTESETYNVLKSVNSVEKRAGGFVIDSSLNNDTTTYVVTYGANIFTIGKENDFYFEVPDVWENGTYNLKLQAKEENFVNSIVTDIEFNLNRIDKVSLVSMERETDLSDVTLSWNAVPNASGYILRMYSSDDTEKEKLLYQFDATKNSYTLTEIFGNNYSDLLSYGKVTAFDLMSDMNVVFTLVTVGTNANNSKAYTFNAKIKGNAMTVENLKLDEFGSLTFDREIGQSYLYRFVGADGTLLSNWKQIDAEQISSVLDTSVVATGALFNVEIVKMGSIKATSSDYNFELDSVALTTVGNDLTYVLNDEILAIGHDENLAYEMSITAITDSFEKLFVGLDEDALSEGKIVTIYPREVGATSVGVQMEYAYSFADLLDALNGAGLLLETKDVDTELYFWSYRDTQNISGSYVVSKPYKFTFSFAELDSFKSIEKVGQIENGKFAEDYANTYVLFDNKDVENSLQTLGVYVKISQKEDEGYFVTKFVTKDELVSTYYDNLFALNLTKLFEEEDLIDLAGSFEVKFSKLEIDLGTQKFKFTDWLSISNDVSFEFERLKEVTALNLNSGNLYWQKQQEAGDRYYVYFAENLNEGKLSENYAYYATTNTYFNASDFAGVGNIYYIAVQSLSVDPYQISSRLTFIMQDFEGESEPAKIYKNQITSPLILKDGTVSVKWNKEGDFYKLLTSSTNNYAKLAEELISTVFTSPFTFTIQDLVDNRLTLSMRFTALSSGTEGIRQNFNINAKNILSDLVAFGQENNFDIEQRLELLLQNANSTQASNYINKLLTLVTKGSYGIANKNILFDDYFEQLQLGGYKLEYCLLGNNTTLNSSWYGYSNSNAQNAFYVNEEPYTRVEKVESETDKSYNDYKIFVKKSNVYNYKDGKYALEPAQSYVLKIYDDVQIYAFAITKGINNYSLSLLGDEENRSVSAYECDADGQRSVNGDYLMFYINHNSGDSLLGVYGQKLEKLSYKMQIYAVGNDYSASSKSKFFNLTLLGFGQGLTVNKGVFTWTPQLNRNTTVIYQKKSAVEDGAPIIIDGSSTVSRFSLDGLGDGLYNYIKFVVIGEIKDNKIFVDSEIYQIDDVYKLSSPKLTNEFGYIVIDDTANAEILNDCYSDANVFNYIVYNDVSKEGSYIDFTDDNFGAGVLKYKTGTTGISEDNADYRYKSTEKYASQFMVASVGTTAELLAVEDETNYYIRKLSPVGSESNKHVALRSNILEQNNIKNGIIDAKMLDDVTGAEVADGVLTWNQNSGEVSLDGTTLQVPSTNKAKVVYQVCVVQYKLSASEKGETEDNVGDEHYYYTTNNYFDFAQIKEEQIVECPQQTYLKVTVRALALYVSDLKPSGDHVSLIEGGYGYGSMNYTNSNISILMSEGQTIKQIDRISPIDENSLQTSDGKLQWTYTTALGLTKDTFFNKYTFVVTDQNGNAIDGTFEASDPENNSTTLNFKITFTEKKGEITKRTQTLKVYATQGSQNEDVTIKSFAREIEINKLKTVIASDYQITSDSLTETLDMSAYFADENTNILTMTAQFLGTEQIDTFTFDKDHCKLYLLKEEGELNYPEDYLKGYITISGQQIVKLTFKATNSTLKNCLFSDMSDEFLLQRSDWGENGQISWNEVDQQFEWTYDGYNCLQEETGATVLTIANITSKEVTLFVDRELTQQSSVTLKEGRQIDVLEDLNDVAKISYMEEEYFISKTDYEEGYISGENTTLSAGVMFKKIEQNENISIIYTDDGKYFQIDSSKITSPVYIVEAIYGEGDNAITRIYTTNDNFFKPTIIGKVGITVRIKLGNSNIQSEELSYKDGELVDFNLFEAGYGTASNPYQITTAEQFKNMAKRQTKEDMLVEYVENFKTATESEQFYFSIQNDIVLSVIDDTDTHLSGVLFTGDFDGVVEGNSHTVSYIAKNTTALNTSITVDVGNVIGAENETSTSYLYGVALFEKLTSLSTIANVNLDVKYSSSGTIPNNSLMAGLTITNQGSIKNVNLTGFSSNFTGYNLPSKRIIMVYSGIASINSGNISKCHVLTDMSLSDNNQSQLIFASGIAFTNHAIIENCTNGSEDKVDQTSMTVVCQQGTDTVQVAGIAITNTSSATLRDCKNYSIIKVECTKAEIDNSVIVYMAGIASLGAGTMASNTNSGTLEAVNINGSNLYSGKIYATNR